MSKQHNFPKAQWSKLEGIAIPTAIMAQFDHTGVMNGSPFIASARLTRGGFGPTHWYCGKQRVFPTHFIDIYIKEDEKTYLSDVFSNVNDKMVKCEWVDGNTETPLKFNIITQVELKGFSKLSVAGEYPLCFPKSTSWKFHSPNEKLHVHYWLGLEIPETLN
jgi:hypothetical protein